MARQKTAKRALRLWQEGIRRAETFLPGSPDALEATRLARYWRSRYRQLGSNVEPDPSPLELRRHPAGDPWFEADVELTFDSLWNPGMPLDRLAETMQADLRRRHPLARIVASGSLTADGRPRWHVLRDGGQPGFELASAARDIRPLLRSFPRDDGAFAARVAEALNELGGPDAASGPLLSGLIVARLRPLYPRVRIVEQTPLARSDGPPVWYCYRDGHALPAPAPPEAGAGPNRASPRERAASQR